MNRKSFLKTTAFAALSMPFLSFGANKPKYPKFGHFHVAERNGAKHGNVFLLYDDDLSNIELDDIKDRYIIKGANDIKNCVYIQKRNSDKGIYNNNKEESLFLDRQFTIFNVEIDGFKWKETACGVVEGLYWEIDGKIYPTVQDYIREKYHV